MPSFSHDTLIYDRCTGFDAYDDREMVLEQLDDVEFGKEGTALELLQFKHHVKRKGGLSDRSSDLWKTIRIWATRILHNQIDIERVRLTLITTSLADADSITGAIKHGSKPLDTVVQLLTDIAEAGGNETNKEAYQAFLLLSVENRMKLVRSMCIADGAPMVQELSGAIQRELRNTALPDHRSKFRHQLEGWWMDRAIRSFSIEEQKTITRNELGMVVQEIRDGYKKDNLPFYYEIKDEVPEQHKIQAQTSTYIRQLDLLHLSEESKKTAMKDYYRDRGQPSVSPSPVPGDFDGAHPDTRRISRPNRALTRSAGFPSSRALVQACGCTSFRH